MKDEVVPVNGMVSQYVKGFRSFLNPGIPFGWVIVLFVLVKVKREEP